MKIYGSKLCPDCQKLLSVLGETDMVFEFLDITENLMNLKMFLKYRDNVTLFERFRESGKIGIPFLILDDGTITHNWENWCRSHDISLDNRRSKR